MTHQTLTPYYQDSAVTIYHGDCCEVLSELNVADLVLTDPPYGHGEKWNGGTWASNKIYDEAKKWDAETVPSKTLEKVIQHGNTAVIWGGNYYQVPPSRCWLAWEKAERMSTLADFELAWTNLDKPSKLFKCRRNQDGKRRHPTQKPVRLMKWCILLTETKGEILDPFMGSGTVLRAAKDLGRKAIGIEKSEKYCEIAAKRMAQEVLPL